MPWTVPSLADLRRQVRDYVNARLPGADAAIPNSPLRVITDNQAGLAALNLDFLAWLGRQMLPDTAEKEYLDRHADIWIGGRLQATFASGIVKFSGVAGTAVPSGTIISAPGVSYQTTAGITLSGVATEVAAECIAAGTIGNQVEGARLSLASAISGVDPNALVVYMDGGIDVESDDHLRDRVLTRIRTQPMGGDADDYEQWVKSTPGIGSAITRVWCAANEMGVGTVTVRFMLDDLRSAGGGFPITQDLLDVAAHLDTLRPVTVKELYIVAPVAHPIAFTINGLSPDTPSMRAAIIAAVEAMLKERARPATTVNGSIVPAQTIYAAWIAEAVMSVAGIDHCTINSVDHVMANGGEIATLDGIYFA